MVGEVHETIRNLLGTYCERMDAGDFAELAALFAEAVLVDEHGAVVADGAGGVLALYGGGTRLYDGSPRTRHVTANPIIEVDASGSAATARSSYIVFQGTEALPLQPIISGRYRDRFALGPVGWHFVERCFIVDQLGDLSHHLTYEVEG